MRTRATPWNRKISDIVDDMEVGIKTLCDNVDDFLNQTIIPNFREYHNR